MPENIPPLSTRAVRGGLWVTLSSCWVFRFGFAANIVLTRILPMDAFGGFALAMFFAQLLSCSRSSARDLPLPSTRRQLINRSARISSWNPWQHRGLNPLTTPGKDHVSHRLVIMGATQREAMLMLYLVYCALGVVAVFLTKPRSLKATLWGVCWRPLPSTPSGAWSR